MQIWYPGAAKKPLGKQTEPAIGIPRVLIFHTMSGYLAGTDSMFRSGGYDGTESHFGVGGSWDKGDLDGVVWQWQDLAHEADAQYAGNAYATSIETSDGAKDNVPWTLKQREALIKIGVWWCRQTGNPARLVTRPGEKGFGYHAQFGVWNKSSHDCPGSARVKQLKTIIIPEVARRLAPPTRTEDIVKALPVVKLHATGEHVQSVQGLLIARSHPEIKVDGAFGTATRTAVKDVQTWAKLTPTGVVDGPTWAALLRVS
ncbi:MAG: peptidoglycan-binding domain-containing protein [Streptosporangiaceae bacterium]